MAAVTSKDGTSIALDRDGNGPHLVLVHGTAANHTRWATIRPRFEDDFTVTAIDRRGRATAATVPTIRSNARSKTSSLWSKR